MLHERDDGNYNSKGVIVEMQVRQAIKMAEFVIRNRSSAKQLIIQSEFPSRQLTAIAECFWRWLAVPVQYEGHFCVPDHRTAITLQMAIDAVELGSDAC